MRQRKRLGCFICSRTVRRHNINAGEKERYKQANNANVPNQAKNG